MALDDPLRYSQSDTGALGSSISAPMEDHEHLFKVVLMDAGTVVADPEGPGVIIFFSRDIDL